MAFDLERWALNLDLDLSPRRRSKQTPIQEREQRLREVVGQDSVCRILVSDRNLWQQLCAAMDAIGDTESAVAAYKRMGRTSNSGKIYLLVYGLLQALFVQQDAVINAAEAIGMKYALPDELRSIREIRNCAVGHPTKRGNGKDAESFGIVRISLTHRRFTLYSYRCWHEEDRLFREIVLRDLLTTQTGCICDAIDQMITHLARDS